MTKNGLRHVDLFSGIGGFALAAHWAGYQTVVFCERDKFCQKVLKKHWPDVSVVGDIHDFNGERYFGADLLTGGVPCQPYSCAGEQLGNDDDRALWPEMRRVIAETKPRWVVIENVAGFIELALDGVLADLEAEGYETGTMVLPACAINAPHQRNRIWIVAYADRPRLERWKILQLCECTEEWITGKGGSFVACADRQPMQRITDPREECSQWLPQPGLGGMDDGLPGRMVGHFDAEPAISRVATGIKNRSNRLKALGNAIVPQVAYQIIAALEPST